MALLIDGDAMSFRAAAYGRPRESTINFLQQQFDDPSRAMVFANTSFLERSREIFDANYGEEAIARLEAVRRSIRRVWDQDDIRPLFGLEDIQNARPRMQRWVMANPFLRNLYKEGRIEGYGDAYIDHKKQGVGKDHYDYRLATSGFATFNDEDGWVATTYGDELLEGDERPTFAEQIDIFETWCNSTTLLMNQTRDVTSPGNNEWG